MKDPLKSGNYIKVGARSCKESIRIESEQRINDILKLEKKSDNLLKEKDEFIREKQALTKQIEDLKHGKRTMESVGGEQMMKQKEESEPKNTDFGKGCAKA